MSKINWIPGLLISAIVFFSCAFGSDPLGEDSPAEQISANVITGTIKVFPDVDSRSTSRSTDIIMRSDMVPAQALVSIYLLKDVHYNDPVATVKTDANGEYEITAEDVRGYLLSHNLITEETEEEGVITAFRALGKVQVRALVVKQTEGVESAIAIQSIADPSDIDPTTGLPTPVAVDPIAHRLIKAIINQIKDSISSLSTLNMSNDLFQSITDEVINSVSTEIEHVLEEAPTSIIEIPEGQSAADVIAAQEAELELIMPDENLESLILMLDSESDLLEDDLTGPANLDEILTAEEAVSDSGLSSSLDDEAWGLLSGLENALNESLEESIETTIEEDNVTLDPDREEMLNELRTDSRRTTLLNLGYILAYDSDDDNQSDSLIVPFSPPAWMDTVNLPGTSYGGNERFRVISIDGLKTEVSALKSSFSNDTDFSNALYNETDRGDALTILTYIRFGETLNRRTIVSGNFIESLIDLDKTTTVEELCNYLTANSMLERTPWFIGAGGHFYHNYITSSINPGNSLYDQLLDYITYDYSADDYNSLTGYFQQSKLYTALALGVLREEYEELLIEHGNDGFDYTSIYPESEDYEDKILNSRVFNETTIDEISRAYYSCFGFESDSIFSARGNGSTSLSPYELLLVNQILNKLTYLYSDTESAPQAIGVADLALEGEADNHYIPQCENLYKLTPALTENYPVDYLVDLLGIENFTHESGFFILMDAVADLYEMGGIYEGFYNFPEYQEEVSQQ